MNARIAFDICLASSLKSILASALLIFGAIDETPTCSCGACPLSIIAKDSFTTSGPSAAKCSSNSKLLQVESMWIDS